MIFTLFRKDIFGQVIKPIQSTSNTRLQNNRIRTPARLVGPAECQTLKKQLSALQARSIRASSLCVFRHQCEALLFYQIKRFNRKECCTHHIHAHTLTTPSTHSPKLPPLNHQTGLHDFEQLVSLKRDEDGNTSTLIESLTS